MLLFPCRPRRRQEADRGGYDMPRVSHSKTLVFLLVHLTSHVAGMAELAGQQAEERCYVKRKPERVMRANSLTHNPTSQCLNTTEVTSCSWNHLTSVSDEWDWMEWGGGGNRLTSRTYFDKRWVSRLPSRAQLSPEASTIGCREW